ncbi:HesB/IscA family protein [Pseudomarimonas salicorniae]|uniref:Iron-sulfur cluster assembly accessory protein n=1 Tax=Pseudomarimonas salicorniae TaxID=2933270 RepID=A0ABT0GKM8_9GAMM|nr:iron-sulfur cluster assembly accessory protein [Lysobacter sp. CAU 1642]MCK7595083.1 iron-sulfur cluster assembly accessory protein [Lysobacter sp. CAU 1642]
MSISLTPQAAARARQFLSDQPGAQGLRFGVKRTGCSGWGYEVDVAHSISPEDSVFEADGVSVVVDAQSLPLVDGTRIDFVRQGLNQVFVFENPNAQAACGCGESFTTEADAVPG